MSKQKPKHPILAKRRKSRGGVRGHLARRNRALAAALAREALLSMTASKDGKLRIPFLPDVPRAVRKDALGLVSAMLGQRGGMARAKSLSSERRAEIARQGGIARWKKG